MTTFQIVDVTLPDHPGILTVTRDPDLERLAAIPGVIDVWTPGAEYISGATGSSFRFRGRINGREMVAQLTTARPVETVITVGVKNETLLGVGVDGLPTSGNTANGSFQYLDTRPEVVTGQWFASYFVRFDDVAMRSVFAMADASMAARVEVGDTGLQVSPHRGATVQEPYAVAMLPGKPGSFVISHSYDGADLTTRVNGVTRTTQAWAVPPATILARFAGSSVASATNFMGAGMRFGAIVLAARSLAAPEVAAVEGYLMQRYGV